MTPILHPFPTVSDIYSSSDDQSSEDERDKKQKRNIKNMLGSDSDGELTETSDDSDDPDDRPIKNANELNSIKLSRFRAEKWCHMPWFREVIVGMYVRVNLGQNVNNKETYRACKIISVGSAATTYELVKGPNRVVTNVRIMVQIGISKKQFRLNFLSNQPFSDSEFKFWKMQLEKHNLGMPNFKEVKAKAASIEEYKRKSESNLSQEDFSKLIETRRKFREKPTSYAREKSSLIKQRQDAELGGDKDKVITIDKRLADINKQAHNIEIQRTGRLMADADKINKNIRRSLVDSKKEKATIAANSSYRTSEQVNPFMRRKTAPMMGDSVKCITGLQTKYKTDINRDYENLVHKPQKKEKDDGILAAQNNKKKSLADLHGDINLDLDIEIDMDLLNSEMGL